MEQISFKLEVFEGPLDLLLHLISKHKLNIEDIEITKLLEQYLQYLDECKMRDLEIAGEFLEMASKLIYIKTVSLLPKPEVADELKKELQGTLIEYSLCKMASETFRKNFIGDDIFTRKQAIIKSDNTYKLLHNPLELTKAFQVISSRITENKASNTKSENKFNTILNQRIVPVTTKIISILRKLYGCGNVDMSTLYDNIFDRSERVAIFLAVLELTQSGTIVLNDDNTEVRFVGRKNRRSQKNAIQ